MEKWIAEDQGNESSFLFSYTQGNAEASRKEMTAKISKICGILWLSHYLCEDLQRMLLWGASITLWVSSSIMSMAYSDTWTPVDTYCML